MSEQNESVEQITADPKPENKDSKKREKDPKKVAAGKKLAEYNKKAKEALAREMKRENEQAAQNENTEKTNNESKAWLPELSFTTVLSVVGLGFTAFDMFMRYRQKEDNKNRIPASPAVSQVPTQTFQSPPIKIHNPQPKIGMM